MIFYCYTKYIRYICIVGYLEKVEDINYIDTTKIFENLNNIKKHEKQNFNLINVTIFDRILTNKKRLRIR